jgi:hypothetical protein
MRRCTSLLLLTLAAAGSMVCKAVAAPAAAIVSPAQLSHYRLNVTVDPPSAKMRVQGRWTVPPLKDAALSFRFFLSPLMESLRISSVRCGDRPARLARIHSQPDGGDTAWELDFQQACAAGQSLQLAFSYESNGKAAPQLRIDSDRGFAGSSGELWYPQRAFSDRETARITLNIPPSLGGIATGQLVAKRSLGGRKLLTYDIVTPGKLAFAYGLYRERTVAGLVPVRVLTFDGESGLDLSAEKLARTIAPLADAFGPPPFRELALVEIDFQSKVLGVSEYGMIFADVSKVGEPYDLVYWAHEFGHQWWGNSVRAESGSEGAPMLSEGLAQYGALYALEQVEGKAAVESYKRGGRGGDRKQNLAGYLELAALGKDRPLVRPPQKDQEEILISHRLATSKGALLLDELARRIGRQEFHRILAEFLAAHRGGTTSWAALEDDINEATNGRFAPELRSWFTDPGVPEPLRN